MTRSRLAAGLFAFLLSLSLVACGGSDDDADGGSIDNNDTDAGGAQNAATVALKDLKFAPDKVTVKTGETVLWKWEEEVSHNVTADEFKSKDLTKGSYSHTFDKAGTYEYRCTIHPGMDGTVVVQ